MNQLLKFGFPVFSVLVLLNSIRTLDNKNIHLASWWDLCWLEMPIVLARIVASVENLDSIDLYQKHGSTQNVASSVGSKLKASLLTLLMEVDELDLVQRAPHVIFVEYLFFLLDVRYFDEVLSNIIVN